MRFRVLVAAAAFLFLPLVACAADSNYSEGTDYRTIAPPMPISIPKGKVQVMELFWYGCPHCFQLDPALGEWVKSKPAYVEFVRVPAVFTRYNPDGSVNPWYIHAKAFYAAQALGVGEKIHTSLFSAIHDQRRSVRTEDELAKFFEEQGVSAKEFKSAFNSFAVDAKVAQAMELTKQSGIDGVPALIVDGRYQVMGRRAENFGQYLDILTFLVAKEHRAR